MLNELRQASVPFFDNMYLILTHSNGPILSVGAGTYRIAQVRPNTVTLVSGGTCTTPSVSVTLPTVPRNVFKGIGSIAATTPFNLSFNHCPAGYRSIGYSFAPTAQVLDEIG